MPNSEIEQIRSMYRQNWRHPFYRHQHPTPTSSSPSSEDQNEIKSKAKMRWIFTLGLLLPALAAIIGVVAWAVSAEVVMGARRDAARKNHDASALRLRQMFHGESTTGRDDDELESKNKLLSNVQSALVQDVYNDYSRPNIVAESRTAIDGNRKENHYSTAENATTDHKKAADLDKIKKTLTGTKVAEVIEKLMAQRKALNPDGPHSVPHIVVVAPLAHPSPKNSTTSTTTAKPGARSTIKFTSVRPTTTTAKPKTIVKSKSSLTTTTTKAPRTSKSRQAVVKIGNKRTTKVRIIKSSTSSTTPKVETTTARFSRWADFSNQNDLKEAATTEEDFDDEEDDETSDQEEQELPVESSVVESITNNANPRSEFHSFLPPPSMKSFTRDNSPFKPIIEPSRAVPFQQFPKSYAPNAVIHNIHKNPIIPSVSYLKSSHPLPPASFPMNKPQPVPAVITGHLPISHHQLQNQNILNIPGPFAQASGGHPTFALPPQIAFPMPGDGPGMLHLLNAANGKNKSPEPNGLLMKPENVPIAQESAHHMQYAGPPDGGGKGMTLNFGGGPMGGGGQIMTSPLGIFKTLLLPLMPKPRMNLNGKVVFGVVLENAVGFGKNKKPQIVAQHYSEGHI